MALHDEIEGRVVRPEPVERLGGRHERRRTASTTRLAAGTLACPACDAPVLPALASVGPGDAISCAFCLHAGAVRDFLSLGEPTRPTRVVVRVRGRA